MSEPTPARREADTAERFYAQGRFKEAMVGFWRAIQLEPLQAEYHYRYACAAWNNGETAIVEKHLIEAAHLRPGHVRVRQALALWYLEHYQCDKALQHAQAAASLDPHGDDTKILMADVLNDVGRYDEAYAVLKPLIDKGLVSAFLGRTFGKFAIKIGREAEAAVVVEKSLRLPNLLPLEKTQLHAALSVLLDRLERYDEAFAQARLQNQGARVAYDPRISALNASKCIQYFTREHLRTLPRASHGDGRPVFIIGMPRSGTSLVEQILASHPAIFGAGELTRLAEVLRSTEGTSWAGGKAYPDCLDGLSIVQADQLAGEYLKTINAIDASATYVIDKMPKNFVHLGAAQILFPQCKVIHCVRDPRDTCLSCYMTYFAEQQFSHDLSHIAQYYRDYQRLMAHWKTALDLPILDVRYEDVVADQEGQTQRMLEFLGLSWNERCMSFHQTARSVTTASRDQVRRPLYKSSVGRWRHYERHIPEFLALCEPAARSGTVMGP